MQQRFESMGSSFRAFLARREEGKHGASTHARSTSSPRLVRHGILTSRAALLALSLASVVELAPRTAAAQSQEDLERARTLFRQGLSLEAAGNWAAALGEVHRGRSREAHPAGAFPHGALQRAARPPQRGARGLSPRRVRSQWLPDLAAIGQSGKALEARIPKLIIRRGQGARRRR